LFAAGRFNLHGTIDINHSFSVRALQVVNNEHRILVGSRTANDLLAID